MSEISPRVVRSGNGRGGRFTEFGGRFFFFLVWCGLQVHSGIHCRIGLAKGHPVDLGEAEAMRFTLSCGQVQVCFWIVPFSCNWVMLLIHNKLDNWACFRGNVAKDPERFLTFLLVVEH